MNIVVSIIRNSQYRDRITLDEIVFSEPEISDWLVGMVSVLPTCGKTKWYMLWLLRPKTEKGADVYSYTQWIQEPFPLTGRTVLTK